MKRYIAWGLVEGAWSFHPSLDEPPSRNIHMLAIQKLSSWVFIEASLHRHDCLNYWPLVINLTLHPSPLLEFVGGAAGPNSNHALFFPVTSPILKLSVTLAYKKTVFWRGMKTKYMFHSITLIDSHDLQIGTIINCFSVLPWTPFFLENFLFNFYHWYSKHIHFSYQVSPCFKL